MRRILVRYAKPGMVLARDLYDGHGHIVLKEGTQLTEEWVQSLGYIGCPELMIVDDRVQDVAVWPLISSELEGAVAENLGEILVQAESMRPDGAIGTRDPGRSSATISGPAITQQAAKTGENIDLTRLRQLTSQMVQQLSPVPKGDPTITGWHSLRNSTCVLPVKIAGLSLLMGKAAGLNETQLIDLGMAALLQNIGYVMVIPQELVHRPGALCEDLAFSNAWRIADNGQKPEPKLEPLTEDELQIVWRHPVYGAEMLEKCGVDSKLTEIILQHHERWNGNGYPAGLKGKDISLSARILAMTDTCCTMVSRKPYRQAFLPLEASELIVACSHVFYDPELVRMFIEQVPFFPTGVTVKLNTGEVGIVTDANLGIVGRPRIRICYDEDSQPVEKPYDIDLAEDECEGKLVTTALEY